MPTVAWPLRGIAYNSDLMDNASMFARMIEPAMTTL